MGPRNQCAASASAPAGEQPQTIMSEELMAAFVEFNDAAYAMGYCQLSQVTAAAARLEVARGRFRDLFVQAAKADALAARHTTIN